MSVKLYPNLPVNDVAKTIEFFTNETVDAAIAAGGQARGEATDEGFMYNRGFHDLDGPFWEVFYLDLSAFPGQA